MNFVIEPGKVDVYIGSSSEDIRVQGEFQITGERLFIGNNKKFVTQVSVK